MRIEPAAVARGPSGLAGIARYLAEGSGWRRCALAALGGALATGAFAPLYLLPLLIPAFTGLLWLLDGAGSRRAAFLLGYSFGLGHMVTGIYWIGFAFLVDAERFAALMPFAVAGVAAFLALFPALAVFVVACTGWRGPARVVLLATAWLAVEWLRSWVLTGLPWNLIGSAWSFSPAMLQLAAVTGVWGLSFLTVLAAAAPAALAGDGAAAPRTLYRGAFVAAMMLLPAAAWAGGAIRLAGAPSPGADAVEGVRLRLVQASIEQSSKWRPELRLRHVEKQIRLTLGPGFERISHVVWPETAVPFFLSEDPRLRRLIARAVPAGGLLITGAPRGIGPPGQRGVMNSLHALNPEGEIVATYDKHHLVPFGEYVPLRALVNLDKLTRGSMQDFVAGSGLAVLDLPGLPPAGPLICYEAIFSGRVVAPGGRPAWLLNITNDAWFGASSGPYQHFAAARLRAVEEGLPLVRAANNGITAMVDAYGRVLGRLGLNEVGVLDVPLPRPSRGITLYSRLGELAALGLVAMGALLALILHRIVP